MYIQINYERIKIPGTPKKVINGTKVKPVKESNSTKIHLEKKNDFVWVFWEYYDSQEVFSTMTICKTFHRP